LLKDFETQVAGLRFETIEKFVVALRDTLPKEELISTSRKADGKNFYAGCLWRGTLQWAIFRSTSVVTKSRDKLLENLPSVT